MLRSPHKIKGKVIIGENCSGVESEDVIIDRSGDITIGNEVIFSTQTIIYTHEHPMNKNETICKQTKDKGVNVSSLVIGDDVFFGVRCIILPQVTNIPKGTVIAAGAVLTKNPEKEYEIWGGNPAIKIGDRK